MMRRTVEPGRRAGDAWAIALSTTCLAHCLLLPIAAGTLPMIGRLAEAEWIHWLFAVLAAPISLWVLTRPNAHGAPITALSLALPGILLLFAGAASWPEGWETVVTVVGALLISCGHVLNWRRRRPLPTLR